MSHPNFWGAPLAGEQILKDSSSVEAERFLFHAVDILKVSSHLGLVLFAFLLAELITLVCCVRRRRRRVSIHWAVTVWMDQQYLC